MMTAVATTVALGSTLGSIGTDICLKTITLTCSKTIDSITYLATNTHPGFAEFNGLLKKTDLKVKISKINQLIVEFKEKEDSGHQFKQSIKLSIDDVDKTIKNIDAILNEAKQLKEYQESLYWSTWRSVDCTPLIEKLTLEAYLLNQRFYDLEKVISIVNHLSEL
jgi:hypothetical protein